MREGGRRVAARGLSVVLWAALTATAAVTPPTLHAQSRLSTALDTTLITVGDRLTLEVRVEHPGDAAVAWPDSVDVAPFEVLETRLAPTQPGSEAAVSAATFLLTTFELGEVELPPFEVRVLHPDGEEEVLATDRYGVEVVSVGVDDSGDIREIRGPLAIPVGLVWLLAWALFLMLLGAAIYAVMARRRAGGDDDAVRSGPPPRPAHEVALEELDRLEAAGLLAQGRIKDFHIRVSDILRRYVEGHFGVPALEMTTWEVLGGLQSAEVDEGIREELRRFLHQCDLVKFAKAEPGEAASRDVLRLGRDFVYRTTPARDERPARDAATGQEVAS